jgi:hypothetical protein
VQLIDCPYIEFDSINSLPNMFKLLDHHGGYNKNFKNCCFEKLGDRQHTIIVHNIVDNQIKKNYPNLKFVFDADWQDKLNFKHFKNYKMHPELDYQNFVCSFNGSDHTGRQLLASALNKFGYFNKDYCSKNRNYNGNKIDGHLTNYVANTEFYNKFFDCTDEFNQQIYSFGHNQYDHVNNIYILENKLTQSFLHIVSETLATSYYPFVTEKFLYSIVIRGLFLAYAQPGWHQHIEKYYGFKLYYKIFDYSFDKITNPVRRLIRLIETISKFSKLSVDDWRDLYLLEQDAIEYNYNHYFSKDYLKSLKQFDNAQTI